MRGRLLLSVILTLAVSGSTLAIPWIAGEFVTSMLSQGRIALTALAVVLVVLLVISGLFSAVQGYLLESIGQRFVNSLMVELHSSVQQLSVSFFDRQKVGELISLIMNDTDVIRRSVSGGLLEGFAQVVTAVGAVVLMFVIDWRLSLVVVATLPLIALVGKRLGRWMHAATDKTQERMAEVTDAVQQSLSGIRVVKSLVREDHESQHFARRADGLYAASMRQAKIMAILEPMVSLITAVSLVVVIYYGAERVASGTLSAGELASFLLYIFVFFGPASNLTELYTQFQESLAAADRAFSLLDTEPEVVDAPGAIELEQVSGSVEFRNVRFSYEAEEEVLKGVQLNVDPGETVALVGPSGAGKTTLVSLLLRFYDVDSGTILIDGKDICEVKSSSVRSCTGLVAQDVLLFSGTIRENIRYGRLSATDAEVETAARAANAHDFIVDLHKGYDTVVGERGVGLSGGQCQRLTIARTLLSEPSILVLDEATSDLDAESEFLVREAITGLMATRTAFVIAHRLSTVATADRIVVLKAGEVVAQGNHRELLHSSSVYKNLYTRQLQQG